jgi:hypothetical protein
MAGCAGRWLWLGGCGLPPGRVGDAVVQPGELAGHHAVAGVGEKPGDAVPVGVGERQLGAGVGSFLAQD